MRLINFLSSDVLRSLFIKMAMAIGVSYLSYNGLEAVLSILKDNVVDAFTGLEHGMSYAGMLGVDIAINYVFSGYSSAFAITLSKKFKLT